MKGRLYIDGVDAFDRYGVFVAAGGYNGIASWAPLKKVECVDWPDEDGVEPDLTEPRLDGREFDVSFCTVDGDKTGDLIEALSAGAYHVFDFRRIGCERRLRLVAHSASERVRRLEKFALRFADDFPLEGYAYADPVPVPAVWQRGYELDARPLSDHGIWVLDGSETELLKAPAVKKNLSVGGKGQSGTIYDDRQVFFQAKDVALKCLLTAPDKTVFWHNYQALLHDLVRPGERRLFVELTGGEYSCYYKSGQVSRCEVTARGGMWCEFTLTLTFTAFRPEATQYLLASERGEWIITEDVQHAIDLKYGY